MHDLRDHKQAQSYLADKGVLVKDDSGAYLFMMDGHILRRAGGITVPTQIIAFDKYAVDLDRLEERTAGAARTSRRASATSRELVNPNPKEARTRPSLGASGPSCMSAFPARSIPSPSS